MYKTAMSSIGVLVIVIPHQLYKYTQHQLCVITRTPKLQSAAYLEKLQYYIQTFTLHTDYVKIFKVT